LAGQPPTVELGEIAITKALDTKKIENGLLFMPTNLTKGIDVSDDPILGAGTTSDRSPSKEKGGTTSAQSR
jgi:hypothetical protein